MEAVSLRAGLLRESLEKSRGNTERMVNILGSFDHRLSALEAAMRPTQMRTSAVRTAHENIEKTLKAADIILRQFDIARQAEAAILKGPHEDLESYLQAVDFLKGVVLFFNSNKNFKSSDGVLSHVNGLLAKSVLKLEEEFKQLVNAYSKPMEPDRLFDCVPKYLRSPAGSGADQADDGTNKSAGNLEQPVKCSETATYKMPAIIPPRILPLLHNLSQQLVQAGNQMQCYKIYRDARVVALESSLRKLGVEKLSRDDVQKMSWEALEAKIGNWIHFMRIAVKLLFAGERKICDQIFDGLNFHKDQCFNEITENSVTMLLSFGEAVARSKKSPEKLFSYLDMFKIMRELQPEIESIFDGKVYSELREAAASLTKLLAQAAQETLNVFEGGIENDSSKTIVPDGTVHPLTSYVTNYVKFLIDYQSTVRQILLEVETGSESDSQLANVTMRIMQALQSNLDGKSKQYKDPSLTYLFLMNNIHYMVKSIRRSEAKDILGDDWIQRHRRIVQQNANQYKRVAWAKILQTLSVQGMSGSTVPSMPSDLNSSGVSRSTIKERFKTFNMQFEELHQKQCQWTVPDPELRESLRLSVAEVLLPAYRSFVKRYGSLVESGRNAQRYVKYTPEELDRLLGELFEGKQLSEPKR